VIVTDRGRPVARLGPLEEEEDTFARLVREGVIIPGRKRNKSTTLPALVDDTEVTGLISEIVLEDRR